MAHELGHVIAPSLQGDDGENFADSFARALLFPAGQAQATYKHIKRLRTKKSRINKIMELSDELVISPVTIYAAINDFAREMDLPEIELAPDIYAAAANLNKTYLNVAETLLIEYALCPPVFRAVSMAARIWDALENLEFHSNHIYAVKNEWQAVLTKKGLYSAFVSNRPFSYNSNLFSGFFILFDFIGFFALFFAADAGFKIADGFAHAFSDLRQFSCTEYDQDDHQDDDQFRHSQTT